MDVKAMAVDTEKVPGAVKLRHVPTFDHTDPDKPVVSGEDTPIAASCYVFKATDGSRQFLKADEASETWAALAPATEGEDMGAVVGELFKLDPRDGSLKWAGEEGSTFPIRQKQLDRLKLACEMFVEKA